MSEDRISEIEDRPIEFTQPEEWENIKKKVNKVSRHYWIIAKILIFISSEFQKEDRE